MLVPLDLIRRVLDGMRERFWPDHQHHIGYGQVAAHLDGSIDWGPIGAHIGL